jgi:hypothetical protein
VTLADHFAALHHAFSDEVIYGGCWRHGSGTYRELARRIKAF